MTDHDADLTIPDIETSLRDLYEDAPCGYLSTTLDGVIIRVNDTFVAWSGYSREQLLGTQLVSLLTAGGQLFYETRYVAVLHLKGEAREVALDLRHASGTTLPVLVNGVVVNDEQGQPVAVRTAVFEYGGRKEYERELLAARRAAETSETRLRLVHEASRSFSAADSAGELAQAVATSAREAFAAPEVCVYLLDEAGRPVLSAGGDLLSATLIAEAGPIELALRQRQLVSVADAEASAPLAETLRAERVETVTVVPIVEHQKRLGAYVMFFRRARVFAPHDVELAETLARQASEVLARLQAEQVLERLAMYDDLTGLPTRRLVRASLNDAIDHAHSGGRGAAVITIDLGGLARIDDTFGRVARDEALVEIGGRLSAAVQEGTLVGRLSDNEFSIVCADTDHAAVESLAHALLAALREPLRAGDGETRVTSSIGAAIYSGTGGARPSWQVLFEGAGQAMYRAKSLGENHASVVAVGE